MPKSLACFALLSLSVATSVLHAQNTLIAPTTLSSTTAPSDAFAALLAAYRAAPIAEHITFETDDATGVIKSDVWLRMDAGQAEPHDGTPPRPARLRLDAGKAIITAEGDRMTFAHALNPTTYCERIVEGGFNAGLLRQLPESPLPQISLTFADLTRPTPTRYDLRMASWETLEDSADNKNAVTLKGTLENFPIALTIDRTTHRLVSYQLTYGTSETATDASSPGKTLRATVEPQVANDPATWTLSLEGRTKVASPMELKGLPSTIEVGQAVPALGLMHADLSGWSLLEALDSLAKKPPQATGTVAAVLVMISPGADARALADARTALNGATRYARDLDMQRMQGLAASPRLIVASVGVLELADFNREKIKALSTQWSDTLKPRADTPAEISPQQLWTSAGLATLQQMAPAQTCAVIVIDQSQRLLAAIPLDSRLLDEKSITTELRTILSTEPSSTQEQK
ncbi:MAG: hypothetical protein U0640_00995 [Phycisphaerales bacterium]